MQQEIIEAFEGLYDLRESGKTHVAIGFFQKYSVPQVESDSKGKRFCDLKLHYKDGESEDIGVLGVPLMYFGNKNGMLDFELGSDDELLVLFTDRTLEQWRATAGVGPQTLTNPNRNSIQHALAIPICSTHNANEVSATPVDSDAIGLRAKPGKKIEIGDGTNEVIDLFDQFLEEMKTLTGPTVLGGSNPVDAAGSSSLGTLNLIAAALSTMNTSITTIQTKLANLKV